MNTGNDVICVEMVTSGSAPSRSRNEATLVVTKQNPHIRIGTRNVQSLYQSGKLENVRKEMERLEIDILDLCETMMDRQRRNHQSNDY